MAKERAPTERLPLTLATATVEYLSALVEKGTHGTSVSDVAKTLIEIGIREAIEREYIPLKESAVTNSG